MVSCDIDNYETRMMVHSYLPMLTDQHDNVSHDITCGIGQQFVS